MITKEDYVTQSQGIILRYKGVLDFDSFYKESKKWFKDHNYIFNEKKYDEKFSGLGNELKVEFSAKRKIDDSTSFNIDVEILIYDLVKEGKRYKLDLAIYLKAYIDLDYNNKWQSNRLKHFLFFVYINSVIRSKIKNVFEDKLFYEVTEFSDFIKEYFT